MENKVTKILFFGKIRYFCTIKGRKQNHDPLDNQPYIGLYCGLRNINAGCNTLHLADCYTVFLPAKVLCRGSFMVRQMNG